MLAAILLLASFQMHLPRQSWLNNQFEEYLLRTKPGCQIFPSTKPLAISDLHRYLETSTAKGQTARVLKERLGQYLRRYEECGGELAFRSDSIARLFISPRYGKKLGGAEVFVEATLKVGKSDEYPHRAWKDVVASDYTRAYLTTGVGRFSFLFGRESLKWGSSPRSSLLLAGHGPPFDMLSARYQTDRFQVSSFFTILNPHADTSRYLSGHRIEFRLLPDLTVGVGEVVLHGGYDALPDPYYLNPLVLFYPREWNKGHGTANILWGIDFDYFGSRWSGYGELMLDDYPYEVSSMNEHPKLGWVLGFRMLDLFRQGEYVVAEYVGVHRWSYGHTIPWQRFVNRGYTMGHDHGNDFDRISVNVTEHLGRFLDVELSAHRTRKGEGEVEEPYPEEIFPERYFLTGVVETTIGMGVAGRWMMGSLWTAQLGGGWEETRNYQNRQGHTHSQPSIHFKLEMVFR
jgi:hypothetical protein